MKEEVFNLGNTIKGSLTGTFNSIGDFLPTLLSAVVLLIIGWIIAKIVKGVLSRVLKAVKFNDLADKVGVNGFLAKGGMKHRASSLVATLGYWIVMFTTLVTFFNTLGLEVVSDLLTDVIKYIPNIIIGCLLLVVGMYLAEFVSGLVVGALKGGGYDNAEMVGRISYGAVMFFAIAIVLEQLGIGGDIVNTVVTVIMSGAGLALALAFGLGGREWAGNLINKTFKS
jgi:hypothetical protein